MTDLAAAATLGQAARLALAEGGPEAVLGLARAARGPVAEATGDAAAFDVTFVFCDRRAAPRTAGLFCPALPGGFALLGNLGGGVFAATFRLPAATRVKYHFCPDPPAGLDQSGLFQLAHSARARRLDVLNPHIDQVHLRGLRVRIVESLLTLPGAIAPLPTAGQPGVPAGRTEELIIDSRALGRRKQGLIYRPAGPPTGPLPVVLLLQGNEEWQETGYFDNLIAAGQVPPFCAVLFRERSFTVRLREFTAIDGGPHTRFVVDELWPELGRRGLAVELGATVAGFSVGGLAAAALAADEPGRFPRLAVVSGALHLTPGIDLNQVSDGTSRLLRRLEHAAVPRRAYLAVGQFEDAWETALQANAVELAGLLRRRGTDVRFDTGPTGHDNESARAYLGAGLGWLLAGR